jgi:hypothetical protein
LELAERVFTTIYRDPQKKKHLDFSKHLRSNWGLGPGKYMLVHYDEKWFWGMVCCRDAKACEELGMSPVTFAAAYHKSHISKVMDTAVVGFAFEDSMDNGAGIIPCTNFLRCTKTAKGICEAFRWVIEAKWPDHTKEG